MYKSLYFLFFYFLSLSLYGLDVNQTIKSTVENNLKVSLLNFGISDEFVEHGSPEHQKVSSGLGKEEITEKINRRLIQL